MCGTSHRRRIDDTPGAPNAAHMPGIPISRARLAARSCRGPRHSAGQPCCGDEPDGPRVVEGVWAVVLIGGRGRHRRADEGGSPVSGGSDGRHALTGRAGYHRAVSLPSVRRRFRSSSRAAGDEFSVYDAARSVDPADPRPIRASTIASKAAPSIGCTSVYAPHCLIKASMAGRARSPGA